MLFLILHIRKWQKEYGKNRIGYQSVTAKHSTLHIKTIQKGKR